MPLSLSFCDVAVNSSSHDSILLECLDNSRPINFRKVGTSGTKGVGAGTRPFSGRPRCKLRRHGVQMYDCDIDAEGRRRDVTREEVDCGCRVIIVDAIRMRLQLRVRYYECM